MALGYLLYPSKPPPQDVIAVHLKTDEVEKVTRTSTMAIPFKERGFDKTREDVPMTLDELKEYNSQGFLTIILIYSDITHKFGHFVLVIGYNSTGIFVHDPWPPEWGSPEKRKSGPNTYISSEMLSDLWNYRIAYHWGLIIPYKGTQAAPPKYACEIDFKGIPADVKVTLYVNGSTVEKVPTTTTRMLEYDKGTNVNITVDPNITGMWNDTVHTNYYCERPSFSIDSLKANMTIQFSYVIRKEYLLKVSSELGNPKGSGWYKEGDTADISVDTPIQEAGLLESLGVKQRFSYWTGNIETDAAKTTVFMNSPKTINAVWVTDYTQAYPILLIIVTPMVFLMMFLVFRSRRKTQQN